MSYPQALVRMRSSATLGVPRSRAKFSWRLAGVAASACTAMLFPAAALATPVSPSAPAGRADPAVTITATSKFMAFGYVLVVFHARGYKTATISGTVTGAAAGQVAELFAQVFPYSKPAVEVSSVTLAQAGTDPYTFTVTPAIATRYQVELLASTTSTTALASSTEKTVYMTIGGSENGYQACKRPICHQKFRLRVFVPASARKTEAAKHLYVYLGLKLDPTKAPPTPKWLKLDHKAKTTAARRISATEYEETYSFSFWIGNDGYAWNWAVCWKDTYGKDGLGLTGHHGCGNKRVRASSIYLG